MQVLINIINNAKEALVDNIDNHEKKIFIYIKENPKEIIISVCDNAGGIKEEIQDKVFNPYFTTKDKKNGTGIGLYMSKTIVDKHLQGSLHTYNQDGGACFDIRLPLVLS